MLDGQLGGKQEELELARLRADAIRAQVRGPVDAVALVREGRDELAQRGLPL